MNQSRGAEKGRRGDYSEQVRTWLKRLGVAGIGAIEWNLAAFIFIAIIFTHGARDNPKLGNLVYAWIGAGVFGFVGVLWSVITTFLAFDALAFNANPFNRPRNDRRDAAAILGVSIATLLAWVVFYIGQYQPPDKGWW